MASLKQVKDTHKHLIKEVMTVIEAVAVKYDINPEDYNVIRKKLKAMNWKVQNQWIYLFSERIDLKYGKHLNPKGEDESIYGKDGTNS